VHESSVSDYTIERLKKRSNGYWSWRVAITKHARTTYIRAGLSQQCLICGYDKHFDVCHKKDVSDFPEEATVKEINNLDNLVALCKNHHWEFDHKLLSKKDKNKIEGA
jgi:predicted restriction endonuclease